MAIDRNNREGRLLSDDRPTLGEEFADSSAADRRRLGESFADPNSLDDTKLGESFAERNASGKQRRQRQDDRPKRPGSRRVFWLIVLVVAIVFLLIFFAGYLPRHERNKGIAERARAQQNATPVIEVVEVTRPEAGSPLVVPGTTTPLTEAYLYARANGYLKRRFVDIGDHVRRGQLLAIIDSPDLDQQVDQAREQLRQAEAQRTQQQAQLALARVTVERYRTLVAKGVFSRQDGDQQETNYNAQLANLAAADRNVEAFRANLNRTIALQSYERVTAPFAGVITERNVDVGALISAQGTGASASASGPPTSGPTSSGTANNAGTSGSAPTASTTQNSGGNGGPLFAVADVSRLRVLVSVPEGYAASVHRGQKAALRFQEFPTGQFSGNVTRTASSIDQNTRTMLTEVQIDNRDGKLMDGMYTVVSFAPAIAGAGPITVSGDAIAVRNAQNVVGLIRDGKVHIQPVEVGRDFGPVVEIVGGLRVGDLIATTVTDDIREGATVDTKLAKQDSPAASGGGAKPASSQNAPPGGSSQYGDQSISDRNMQGATAQEQGKSGGKQGGKGANQNKGESKQ